MNRPRSSASLIASIRLEERPQQKPELQNKSPTRQSANHKHPSVSKFGVMDQVTHKANQKTHHFCKGEIVSETLYPKKWAAANPSRSGPKGKSDYSPF
jgi:hypothetical protein